jgi:hypothetical protein
MKAVITTTLSSMAISIIAWSAFAQHPEHGHTDAPVDDKSALTVPSAMQVEHAHLHHQLAEAVTAGGKTAEAAKKVESVLSAHFVEEDAYALPPLGLLQTIAQGKQPTPEQAHAAMEMADKLRANYDKMLDEHKQLTASLKELAAAAKAENKPGAAAFAEVLTLHAQNEEQILYPATLMIGEYLKLRSASDKH